MGRWGGRDIGAVTAKCLARQGARAIVADVLEEQERHTAQEIAASGAQAVFVRIDVTRDALPLV